MAAAVLELGSEEASPMEKTLEYLLCLVVVLSTSTHPAESAVISVLVSSVQIYRDPV